MIEVCIGMPVYNGEKHIKKALNSLLPQLSDQINLIISDNCSTDDTYKIIEELTYNNSFVKLYKQEKNIGVWNNFSFVLKIAESKYFMWASHDDVWNLNYVEETLKLLKYSKFIGACGDILLTNNDLIPITTVDLGSDIGGDKNLAIKILCCLENKGYQNLLYSLFQKEILLKEFQNIKCPDSFPFKDLVLIYRISQNHYLTQTKTTWIHKRFPFNIRKSPFKAPYGRPGAPIIQGIRLPFFYLLNTSRYVYIPIIFIIFIAKGILNIYFSIRLKLIQNFKFNNF